MKRTIFLKTFVSYIGVSVLVLTLIYLLSQPTIKNFYINQLKKHLTQTAEAIKPQANKLYQNHDELQKFITHVGTKAEIRLTVIDPVGRVLADSQNNPAAMDDHSTRSEINNAITGIPGHSLRFSSTMGEEMFYLAIPVSQDGDVKWILRLSLFFSDINILIKSLRQKMFALLVVLFVLSLILSYFFSKGISNPIKEISQATQRFTDGDHHVKIYIKSQDELKSVADNFNRMVDEKGKLITELSENREELQAIISTMHEGLLLLDREGRILHGNDSFEAMWGKINRKGSHYWEVVRLPDFEKYVERAIKTLKDFYEEIDHQDKNLLVGFNPIKQGEKLLITFRDITEFKQLEKIKKDFIVNLTHELKTPLTAIKGFVEILEDVEENPTHKNYIEIIKRHSDRMNQIILDLMTLSELEEKKTILEWTPINLKDILDNIVTIFKDSLKGENLKLIIDIDPNLPTFQGERFKIEQLFINLIDNAIKYTEEGKITISAQQQEEDLILKIQDTGIGIPSKNLPRIFERFYVVDRSRSRKLGGTGLGLSIVKHIIQLHNGEIKVDSEVDKGTTFSIRFSKQNQNQKY